MRKVAVVAVSLGAVFGLAAPAAALNPQPEPPGAQVVAVVSRAVFPDLPPNPCLRIPGRSFIGNPVLPPNPCLTDARADVSFGGRTGGVDEDLGPA